MYTYYCTGAEKGPIAPSTVPESSGLDGGVRMLDGTVLQLNRRHSGSDGKAYVY